MHQMSPGVARAVAGGREWAEKLESPVIRLSHLLLALLDEEEGRPAVLLERAGLVLGDVRTKLGALQDVPLVPLESALFSAASRWSIAHRHDPEFLTDAFLLAVLRTDATFQPKFTAIGLDADRFEQLLIADEHLATGATPVPPAEVQLAVFAPPDAAVEIDAARVLDVNFNRAREAARVLEDYCRFVLDDRLLTEQIKQLRHGLATASEQIPAKLLLAARETLQDVGTGVTAPGEYDRGTPAQVAAVNLKRLQESLRSLEEFGKLVGAELGRTLESLRYSTYTLERAIMRGGEARTRLAAARLYVLLTGSHCTAALDWTIARAAAGGAEVIQLREKDLSDRELLARAREVRQWTRKADVLFIMNDRPDLARLAEADGVHLGQDDVSVKDARRILGPDALIGVSTHNVEQVRQTVLDGADYIGVGPVFPSATKEFEAFPGLDFVREANAETTLPAFALGGIDASNLGAVISAGAKRVAVSSAIAKAEDPEAVARRLRSGL